jgi:hypothetical protein
MKDDDAITAHELLQGIYRNEEVPLPVRMRAAIESLPFEVPKLSAVASAFMDNQSFGALLDKAIERSSRPLKLVEAQAVPTAESAEVISSEVMPKPFSSLRRRI